MYFIANWKMFGDLKSLNTLNNVIKFSKTGKFNLIYCPPYTLLDLFSKKLKQTKIKIGAQNCHEEEKYGAYTGSINSKMLKNIGCQYVILGHSENRMSGETDFLINKKIKSAIKNGLKIIFCIGETLDEKKKKITQKIILEQISKCLKGIIPFNNILVAYEPVWSIGTGLIPNNEDLKRDILYIKNLMKKKFRFKNPKVLYGGSVSQKNIDNLKKINTIDGFLIGGASQDAKKFIDIVKKTYN